MHWHQSPAPEKTKIFLKITRFLCGQNHLKSNDVDIWRFLIDGQPLPEHRLRWWLVVDVVGSDEQLELLLVGELLDPLRQLHPHPVISVGVLHLYTNFKCSLKLK